VHDKRGHGGRTCCVPDRLNICWKMLCALLVVVLGPPVLCA